LSTKIYDAHLWQGTADELAISMHELRKQYIEEAAKELSKWSEDELKEYSKKRHNFVEDQYFYLPFLLRDEIRKGENTPFNFDASVVVYFYKGKIVAIPFGLTMFKELETAFRSNPKMKFYGYWDNVEPDEDCSEEEWEERKEFFDGLFDDSAEFYHFGSLGFTYELSNQETLWKICDKYREMTHGREIVR